MSEQEPTNDNVVQPPPPPANNGFQLPSADDALQRLLAELEVAKAQIRSQEAQLQQTADRLQNKAKMSTPKHLFDGKMNWKDHLFRNEQEARMAGNVLEDEKRRGDFLITSLTGSAATLARQLREKDELPETYAEIVKVLEPAYLKTGEMEEARVNLRNLQQKTQGAIHNAKFNTLIVQAGYDKDSMQTREEYLNTLSNQVRDKIVTNPFYQELPFNELQSHVEKLITQLSNEHLRQNGGRKIYWEFPNQRGKRKFEERTMASVNKEKEKSGKRHKSDVTCYNCQGKGHYSKECRKEKRIKPCGICKKGNHSFNDCPLIKKAKELGENSNRADF